MPILEVPPHCDDDCPCRNGARRDAALVKAARRWADRVRPITDAAIDRQLNRFALLEMAEKSPSTKTLVEAILVFRDERHSAELVPGTMWASESPGEEEPAR